MIIGYCYVCGDILHKGHILHLKNCKSLCDKLICGVLTDEAVMEKKPKPILDLDERMTIVESIKYVDVVVPQQDYSPTLNCELLQPDILFESSSHETLGRNEERKVVSLPYYPNQSSTNIKNGIKNGNSET